MYSHYYAAYSTEASTPPTRSPIPETLIELRGLGLGVTYSLHCSSFLGLPYRILIIRLVKPTEGTTVETAGSVQG